MKKYTLLFLSLLICSTSALGLDLTDNKTRCVLGIGATAFFSVTAWVLNHNHQQIYKKLNSAYSPQNLNRNFNIAFASIDQEDAAGYQGNQTRTQRTDTQYDRQLNQEYGINQKKRILNLLALCGGASIGLAVVSAMITLDHIYNTL